MDAKTAISKSSSGSSARDQADMSEKVAGFTYTPEDTTHDDALKDQITSLLATLSRREQQVV